MGLLAEASRYYVEDAAVPESQQLKFGANVAMMKLVSRMTLPIAIVAIAYLMISGNLFASSPFVIAAQLLAVVLAVWARRTFKRGQFSVHAEPAQGALLSSGPYKVVRHPMYTAALLLVWSGILGHLSIANLVIGLIVTAAIAIRIVTEEQYLRARFHDYEEYSRRTSRIIPFIF
ncbi:MAG: isoprenylcysteine carboxylmethyltransferase family protein [Steroidobacteraceae bacterium]